jgi:hypothetical protein
MKKSSEARLGTIKSWGRHVLKELATVRRLLGEGIALEQFERGLVRDEVVTLVEPHLAVLVYKRAKIRLHDGTGTADETRWTAELCQFANRWPHLAANAVERSKLVAELDRIVAAEQKRLADAARSPSVPVTSRFDTSWAT